MVLSLILDEGQVTIVKFFIYLENHVTKDGNRTLVMSMRKSKARTVYTLD